MIKFKAKIEKVYNMDDTVAYQRIKLPKFTRSHCDMSAFRKHKKYGGIANSDLFLNALARIARDLAPDGYIRLDRLPSNITVDDTGFLAEVNINLI